MADRITFAASVIVGLICISSYILVGRSSNPKPRDVKLETIFTLFLRSGGLVGGVSLVIYTFWEDIRLYLLVSNLHIFLGGIAVIFISMKGIIKDIKLSED